MGIERKNYDVSLTNDSFIQFRRTLVDDIFFDCIVYGALLFGNGADVKAKRFSALA